VNDQDLPESGATPTSSVPMAQASANESIDETQRVAGEEDALAAEDDSFEEEDFGEEDADLEEEDIEGTKVASKVPRSLMEEIFDEDELFEVLSELDVLTLEEAAAYLKVEYGAIRKMLKEQGLPGRKIGDEWRFLRGAIADWLRAPGGSAVPVAVARPERVERVERPAQPERPQERPQREDRREATQRPPFRERFPQDNAGGGQGSRQQGGSRYPQQGGSRYPQQGGARYPQEGRPPQKRPPFQYEDQQSGGYSEGGGQGGYPPPRRPSYGSDQQQPPQGEYRPPPRRPPFRAGQEGNFGDQAGGNFSGGGSRGGQRFAGGPKKPKRKALNEQRFKRLDRRQFGGDTEQGGPPDSNE